MVRHEKRLKLRVGRRKLRAKKQMRNHSSCAFIVIVSRSNKAIYAQAVEVATGVTVAGVRSQKSVGDEAVTGVVLARQVGVVLGNKLSVLGIKLVSFDRRGLKYHGRVASVAEGLRSTGVLK